MTTGLLKTAEQIIRRSKNMDTASAPIGDSGQVRQTQQDDLHKVTSAHPPTAIAVVPHAGGGMTPVARTTRGDE